jgi:hypothetical protein
MFRYVGSAPMASTMLLLKTKMPFRTKHFRRFHSMPTFSAIHSIIYDFLEVIFWQKKTRNENIKKWKKITSNTKLRLRVPKIWQQKQQI